MKHLNWIYSNANIYKVLFVLSLVGIIYPIYLNVFWDESIYLLHAKYFAGKYIGYNEMSFRSLFLSLMASPLYLFTNNLVAFKLLIILFAQLSIFIFYLIIKQSFSMRYLYFGLFIFSASPLIQLLSKRFLTEIPAILFFIFSLYFLIKQKFSQKDALLAGLTCALMLITRLGFIYLLPVYPVFFIIRKDFKSLVKFCLGFFLILVPHQLWIYFNFDGFFFNFIQARAEGLRNSNYSFKKIYQILLFIGPFSFVFGVIGLWKGYYKKILIIFIFLALMIPYNEDNYRFLIPLVPCLCIGILSFLTFLNSTRAKNITILIITLEILTLTLYHRITILPEHAYVETNINKMSKYIVKYFENYNTILTSLDYPDFALQTNKEVINPLPYVKSVESFNYVQSIFFKENKTLIIANKKSIPNISFLFKNDRFMFHKKIGPYYLFSTNKFFKTNSVYRAFKMKSQDFKGYHSHGYLVLKNNKAHKFIFTLAVSNLFIQNRNLSKCNLPLKITFTDIASIQISKINDVLMNVQLTPKKWGDCVNDKNMSVTIDFKKIDYK